MELVSVLMSVYKEPINYIQESINSIVKQTYLNLEIIVIIDNPDNREAINFLEEVSKKDKRIKIFRNEKNEGLVYSLNKGISLCSGKYIARMDADDISDLSRIDKQLKFLKNGNCDLVSSNFILFNNISKEEVCFPKDNNECIRSLRHKNCMPHPVWFGKKDVFVSLGGYREIESCEDYDFLIRAALKKYRLGNVQEFLLEYRYNEESISRKNVVKQNVNFRYLMSNYRKNYSPTMEEYRKFLESTKYYKWVANEKKLYKIKCDFLDEKTPFLKFIKVITYMLNPFYLYKKLILRV